MVSRLQVCQRTLVRLLQAVAAVLQVPADVTRESTPDAIKAACARVLRGARRVPEPEGLHDLKIAQAAWKEALQGKHERGRPKKGTVDYRIQATAVLLTVLRGPRPVVPLLGVCQGQLADMAGQTVVRYLGNVQNRTPPCTSHAAVPQSPRTSCSLLYV